MRTNIRIMLLSPALLLCSLTGWAAGQTQPVNEIWYTSSDNSVITPKNCSSIISNAFDESKGMYVITFADTVTSIGNYAFQGCSSLTAVTIPNSVVSIGNGAFCDCSSLTAVTFAEGSTLKSIGNYAFQGCSSLTAVTIPNSVVSIGDDAFHGCSSLTAVTIPNSVVSIGDSAFYYCSSLTAVTFAEGSTLKSIGQFAFSHCSSLTSITIPNSVESIGKFAFSYCSSLTSITIPNSVESIGDDAFSYCYFNISNFVNESKLDAQSNNYWGAIIFDTETNDGLRITGSKVVGCRPNTSSITIPNSVESIGDYAFYGCTSLTAVTFAEGSTLKSIGEIAFMGCSSLTSIAIPNSVESIGNYAFMGCSSLTSIAIPDSVESIGNCAFMGCSSLTAVTFAEGSTLKSIGEGAFASCSGLTSITIPDSVESIGNSAFANCCFAESNFINNSKLDAQANGYWGAVIIDTETNDGLCITDSMVVLCRPNATSVIIPSHIESIGDNAFYGCTSLTSVNIPNSIESIGNNAFNGCFFAESSFINNSKLDARANGYWGAVIIDTETNDGLCIIDNMVVLCRPNATSITIPNTITGINSGAFIEKCSLETVFCLKATPPAIAGTVFKKCPNLSAIYVDASYIDDYKSAPGWSSYASIINEYNPEPFKNAALAEIRAAMQGETGSAYLNELVSVELTNIESATDGNTIETNKSAAIAKLNAVISAFQAGKAEAIGDFGTMTDGPAVRATKGDRTIILYNPDRVDFIKITSEE